MGKLMYYIDRFMDETMPCQPTLEGWAEWLNKPDTVDGWTAEPSKNGEQFEGHISECFDVVATYNDEKEQWEFDPPDISCDWCAETFGPGLGWVAEMIGARPSDLLDYAERDEPIDMAFMQDRGHVTFEFNRDEHGRPYLNVIQKAEPVSK